MFMALNPDGATVEEGSLNQTSEQGECLITSWDLQELLIKVIRHLIISNQHAKMPLCQAIDMPWNVQQ